MIAKAAIGDGRVASFATHQGMYSSKPIEDWVAGKLAELVPNAKPPIRFADLKIPVWIVATDLLRGDAKVWSTERTPDDSVASAVRASCAIPVFFDPVDQRYVDGGVVSNLPSFVFTPEVLENMPYGARILAFALVARTASVSHGALLASSVCSRTQLLRRTYRSSSASNHASTSSQLIPGRFVRRTFRK